MWVLDGEFCLGGPSGLGRVVVSLWEAAGPSGQGHQADVGTSQCRSHPLLERASFCAHFTDEQTKAIIQLVRC